MFRTDPQHLPLLDTLICFLAKRDLSALSKEKLTSEFNIPQADLLILLGNSSLFVAEQAAEAYKNGLAKELMICGGIGHSTKYLAANVRKHLRYQSIETENRAEAEILKDILTGYWSIAEKEIILENNSTNCGTNASEAYNILTQNRINPKNILLLQDPVLQLRSSASFQKTWENTNTLFINYACFIPEIKFQDDLISFANPAHEEFCDMERFISLVMGEIPRLRNDENGYGPKGRNFIAEVMIPKEVLDAYKELEKAYKGFIRT